VLRDGGPGLTLHRILLGGRHGAEGAHLSTV
jgi:hypothetical protein